MGIEVGLIGLIVLALNVWAIIKVLGSSASTLSKVIWIVLILIAPVLGLVAWYFIGPKS